MLTTDDVQKLDDGDLAYYLRYPIVDDRVQQAVEREALRRIFVKVVWEPNARAARGQTKPNKHR